MLIDKANMSGHIVTGKQTEKNTHKLLPLCVCVCAEVYSGIVLKVQVHLKMINQSSSAHPHVDGKAGDVSVSTKHFWTFAAKTVLQRSLKQPK